MTAGVPLSEPGCKVRSGFEARRAWPLAAAALVGALLAFGASRWHRKTACLRARLEAVRHCVPIARNDGDELEGLPPPVQRYFRLALRPGQAPIAAVDLRQAGTINLSRDGDRWKPFTAEQRIVMHRPGFDWDARIRAFPGATVRVHDAYVAGEGVLEASLWGLVPLAAARGTPEAARGELMRYLAEAAWYPTALLPSQGLRWDAVDAMSAHATLCDGDTEVTLLFTFDSAGLIEAARARSRGAAVGKTVVMTPWEGRWANYQLRDGMRVPMEGEAAWLTPKGRRPYWRGSVIAISYDYEPVPPIASNDQDLS